ncbi:MFS general substrate transporter [Pleomassaria siparia CBS 279.74]|uniref:MFS general substrate transporter n=1 Tax=Pleomassaria siparia CBS 279.74 TaxID=1314801 RepID=A0A6G1KT70_9PLEO|nr:MFS general substrate transporter [Pleomassaria siparia CBS 279.74]
MIQSYMFFQLKFFDPSASDATISTQIGFMIGCKTAAHVCTGLIWGSLADHASIGRKCVLVTGLFATSLATLGYGFSETFKAAVAWQVLDGALNATLAMVRCMISELNPEKRYRVRALTLLPLCANIGSLLGSLIGGFLASATTRSSSGMTSQYPYAAPNICVAVIQALVGLAALFALEDTLHHNTTSMIRRDVATRPTETMAAQDLDETSALLPPSTPSTDTETRQPTYPSPSPALPFKKMWTPNVISTMLAHFIISGHLGTFASLWAVFLSMPVKLLRDQHPPVNFSGGLGMRPHSVGLALSAFGFAGIILQILVYPSVQERWGTIKVWRGALCVFPVVYLMAPFLALIASLGRSGEEAYGDADLKSPVLLWISLLFILILFVAGRTGVVPATSLLINDCTPHPSVRGTIHTTGVIVSNLSKAFFPPMAFAVLGYGLRIGIVGLGFWFVAALAVLSCVASLKVREGRNGEEGPA